MKKLIPKPVRKMLRTGRAEAQKKMLFVDRVTDWSLLRKLEPHRRNFGADRGACIDRFYIEQFIAEHSRDLRGCVAEFESDLYARRFGGDAVEHCEVLDVNEKNDRRTMTVDLSKEQDVPKDYFDCIVCTQTLFLIEDYRAALRSLHAMLREGGVLLMTVPGICQRVPDRLLAGEGEDLWRFTARSAARVSAAVFGAENVAIQPYGNVLTAVAFLHGLVQAELTQEELAFNDPDFELVIGVRAVKRTAR